MGRIRTEAEWLEVIRGQGASGLSQEQYCEKHKVSKTAFWVWKKRLSAKPKSKMLRKPKFIEMPALESASGRQELSAIELKFPNGVVLTMSGSELWHIPWRWICANRL